MSPVEELRAAATKIREIAAKATLGPWQAGPEIQGLKDVWGTGGEKVCQAGVDWPCVLEPDAEWIALMGPDKAAVLAAWLDRAADSLTAHLGLELAFARSILGGAE